MNLKISEIMECLPEDQAYKMYYSVTSDKQDVDMEAIKGRVYAKMHKQKKPYFVYWKQIACILLVAFMALAWNMPGVKAAIDNIVNMLLSTVTPITDEVRDYVGQSLESEEYTIKGKDGKYYNQDGEIVPDIESETVLPENAIVKENTISWMTPSDISIFKVTDTQIPEIMIPNGALAVFTNNREIGWDLKAGDSVTISYEVYQHETISEQALMIGYIQDGTLVEGNILRNAKGECTFEIESSGIYNFYFMGLSSDPISIQSGDLEME